MSSRGTALLTPRRARRPALSRHHLPGVSVCATPTPLIAGLRERVLADAADTIADINQLYTRRTLPAVEQADLSCLRLETYLAYGSSSSALVAAAAALRDARQIPGSDPGRYRRAVAVRALVCLHADPADALPAALHHLDLTRHSTPRAPRSRLRMQQQPAQTRRTLADGIHAIVLARSLGCQHGLARLNALVRQLPAHDPRAVMLRQAHDLIELGCRRAVLPARDLTAPPLPGGILHPDPRHPHPQLLAWHCHTGIVHLHDKPDTPPLERVS